MLKNKNNIYVEHSDRPSRFMVDLNMVEKQNQAAEEEYKIKNNKNYRFKKKTTSLLGIVFGIVKSIFVFFDKILDSIRLFIVASFVGIGKLLAFARRRKRGRQLQVSSSSSLDRLAIFSLIKFCKNKIIAFSNISTKLGLYIFSHIRSLFLLFKFRKEVDSSEDFAVEAPARFTAINFKYLKSPLLLALVMFALVSPLKIYTFTKSLFEMKGRVLGVSELAIDNISNAKDSASELDFLEARRSFDSARVNFEQAREEIGHISTLLGAIGKIVPNKNIKLATNAEDILLAGSISADLGNHLSEAMSSLTARERSVKSVVESFYENGKKSSKKAKELSLIINSIDSENLPDEYRKQFELLRNKTEVLTSCLDELVDMLEKARIFLGFEYDKRYLLVFQNNTELRASGGFIGSYAVIDFRNGEIRKIDAPGGGSYDTEGGLTERIIAPAPLHLVNPLWHFWDANWWPDWKKSAKKLMWFYEKSGGTTVDGVISFTPTMLESFLEVIGPVDMTADYGVVIDADNFWLTVQSFAEQKQDITNKPKKIIGDMFHKILEVLPERLNKETFLALSLEIEKTFQEKHALFYFSDSVLQEKVENMGWAGRMRNTAWDYLMVVNTNIAGGKSDRKIQEEITHASEVDTDGSIINIVKIRRMHTGVKREDFSGVRNVNWMRVYVPLGSKFIEARGFKQPDKEYFDSPEEWWSADPDVALEESEVMRDIKSRTKIYNESGKTVFANWSMVDPGESTTIYIKYKLPFKMELDNEVVAEKSISDLFKKTTSELIPYALLVQKQPGTAGSKVNSILKLPENYKNKWQYPEGADMLESGWHKKDVLDTDKYWALLLEN